ncbi:O-methyltransferase [Rhodococcoides yunnanense]|uniref:O-methyltransferase n=1 Tax=Rhodococcoides yunnanense TaxID=278209 RepID=UPI0009341F7A|nr:class I SAM-dependent methyltransferase [Rhodococcus yunnanensis]
MTTTLDSDPLASTLRQLYAAADAQRRGPRRRRESDKSRSAQQRADDASEVYMPIDPDAGRLLYSLVRATQPTVVVEFGMSFGISTLHLAAAVRDNGSGRVVTTELSADKVAAAQATFDRVGVSDVIEVRVGDALDTLQNIDSPVGFVLLDGWKEMYLPVLNLLEDRLPSGTLVAADNAGHAETGAYLDHVRDPAHGYVSFNFPSKQGDSMELSLKA